MRQDNVTCVQRTRFFFYYFEKNNGLTGERPPLDDIVKAKRVSAKAVRNFSKFLSSRLERIATMMELLSEAHDDWAITGKKDYILMETETYEFNDAIKILKEQGFDDSEFNLNVEYTRKWGVL